MTRLPDEFHQDKALRNAAREVLSADIEHLRDSLTGKSFAGRVVDRVGDGAKDVFEIAKGHAGEKQGILAGIVALLILWFARGTIAELLGLSDGPDDAVEDADPGEVNSESDETPDNGEPPARSNDFEEQDYSEPEPLATGETA